MITKVDKRIEGSNELAAMIADSIRRRPTRETSTPFLGIRVNVIFPWMCKLGIADHRTIVS